MGELFSFLIFGYFGYLIFLQVSRENKYKNNLDKKSQASENRIKNKVLRNLNKADYTEHAKSHSGYCVYHIGNDLSDLSLGYIGVTNNFGARKSEHIEHLKIGCHVNHKLQYAFDIGEINEESFRIVSSGLSKSEAYNQEYFLRSRRNMGWNIKKGGQYD